MMWKGNFVEAASCHFCVPLSQRCLLPPALLPIVPGVTGGGRKGEALYAPDDSAPVPSYTPLWAGVRAASWTLSAPS